MTGGDSATARSSGLVHGNTKSVQRKWKGVCCVLCVGNRDKGFLVDVFRAPLFLHGIQVREQPGVQTLSPWVQQQPDARKHPPGHPSNCCSQEHRTRTYKSTRQQGSKADLLTDYVSIHGSAQDCSQTLTLAVRRTVERERHPRWEEPRPRATDCCALLVLTPTSAYTYLPSTCVCPFRPMNDRLWPPSPFQ